MGLSVIGAGFGRTGTLSLKGALEQLGFGPCHHMAEVFAHPEQIPVWKQATAGAAVDWDKLLAGYRATVDWPSAYFWRELAGFYPDAKVLLSTRDVDAWYASFSNTILRLIAAQDEVTVPAVRAALEMGAPLVSTKVFGGRADDPEHAKAVFRAHEAEVCRTIPAERLLVFDVREGWEPLCAFLGVPVPDGPFPRLNDAEQFKVLTGG
ncbi:sulfotransferase family protein [Pelagibius marinus]|uniref:sulfotransferase family protein n=1 Tax=Pelagibius marinus TaxID=2762760 RepID=UPI0018733670|nr:sulfotransferase family protein [Pelagibius marinus]